MPSRHVAWCAFAVAVAAIVCPLFNRFAAVWPLTLASLRRRYGVGGLLPSILAMPSLGMILLFWPLSALEKRRSLRVFWVTAALAAVLLADITILFVFNSLQLRGQVIVQGRHTFDKNMLGAVVNYACQFLMYTTFAVAGFRSVRATRQHTQAPPGGLALARPVDQHEGRERE